MTTGDRFVSIASKRLLGTADFGTRFLEYMKNAVADVHRSAYGLDGIFGGTPIQIEAFTGEDDRFQLSIDALCSDGDGHFLETDEELSGRDVGIQFKNSNAVEYNVALHYAERARGIQINPRTTAPEFVSFEETIGFRDEPNTVTDNEDGTITFRIDTVCEPFGGTVEDHTGRQCLVWKKAPGKLAITEELAVEQLVVDFVGGQNVIESAGLFGQAEGLVSENASDYFVLLLGPTVNSNTNLEITAGYTLIGHIQGNGPAAEPVDFDIVGQNDLASGFSVDLNAVTRLDPHGDLKIRVQADALDGKTIAVSAVTVASNMATATVLAGHGLSAGLEITNEGFTDSGTNTGAVAIDSVDATHIVFPFTAANGAQADGVGSIRTVDEPQLEVQNAGGDTVWDVDQDGDQTMDGNLAVGGTLAVTGITTLTGTMTANGATNLNGNNGLGNAETDVHTMKGKLQHRTVGLALLNEFLDTTGEVGFGGAAAAGKKIKAYGDTRMGFADTHVEEIMSILRLITSGGATAIEASGAGGAAGAKMNIGGAVSAMGSELFRVTGLSDLRDQITLGAILNAGTATQGATKRLDFGNINAAAIWNGLLQWKNSSGTNGVHVLMIDGGFGIGCNCHPSSTGTGTWSSDNTALSSLRLTIVGGIMTLAFKAATASTWTDSPDQWDAKHNFNMASGATAFAGNTIPNTAYGTPQLGTTGARWLAFLQDTNLAGHIIAAASNTYDFGALGSFFRNIFATDFTCMNAGEFNWATVRTFKRSFAPRPTVSEYYSVIDPTTDVYMSNYASTSLTDPAYLHIEGAGGISIFGLRWNFLVPDGATITKITMRHRTGSGGVTGGVIVRASRQPLDGSNQERFESSTTTYNVGTNLAADTDRNDDCVLDTAAALAEVDNGTYLYCVELSHSSARPDARVYGFTVEYELDHVVG